jgi:PAS domain S-box-containing protein
MNSASHFKTYATVIILLFLLPFVAAVYMLVSEKMRDFEFVEKELAGLNLHKSLFSLLIHAQNLRGNTFIMQNGGKSSSPLDELKEKFYTALSTVDAHKLDCQYIEVCDAWTNTRYIMMRSFEGNHTLSPIQKFETQSLSLNKLYINMKDVGHASNLILDPDLNTYLMIYANTHIIPSIIENMAYIRGKVSGLILNDQESNEKYNFLQSYTGKFDLQKDEYIYNSKMVTSTKNETIFSEKKAKFINKIDFFISKYLDKNDNSIIKESSEVFYKNATDVIIAINDDYEQNYIKIRSNLEDRISSLKLNLAKILGTLFVSFLASTLLFTYFYKKFKIKSLEKHEVNVLDIFNKVATGMLVTNQSGVIVEVSAQIEQMMGCFAEELMATSLFEYVTDSERPNLALEFENAQKEESYTQTNHKIFKGKRKNGETFKLSVTISPTPRNGEMLYTFLLSDLSIWV